MTYAAVLAGTPPALAEQPARVVSINLCTDQLAMLLADPGQLVSVTHLASDPLSSSMVDEAAGYVVNRGQAEQVFLLRCLGFRGRQCRGSCAIRWQSRG